MWNTVREGILKYIPLSEGEFERYYHLLEFKSFNKRENLLSIEEVCRCAFFIQKGCIRYYNLVDGEEHTSQFLFEGAWYSDYESFLFERPTLQTIQALENTEVAVLSKSALQKLYVEAPIFERFGRLMAENAFLGLRRRTENYTQLSADERYLKLLKQRPKVIERVPQHYIASYLGIKPPSLSRIRKRVAGQKS